MRYKIKMRTFECDAIKWTAGPDQEDDPLWLIQSIKDGRIEVKNVGTSDVKMVRHCGNFDLTAHVGDYIIHYDDGTIDFMDADTFNNYFERI